jgi:uncharacterized membrane protein
MAVPAEKNVHKLIHWMALRRLAFRFDPKTKLLCVVGFVLPGLVAVSVPIMIYVAAVIGLIVLAVVPVLTGKSAAKEIQERFGDEVLKRALRNCTFGRYMRNKHFTIGDIQDQIEREMILAAANDDSVE